MPVDTKHKQYGTWSGRWQRCRDAIEGEDAIKAQGSLYLPKLTGADSAAYKAYLNRALFYGATGRTVAGLLGAIFRQSPSIELPTRLEYLRTAADPSGTPLSLLARNITAELLSSGRYGVLVDLPATEAGLAQPYYAGYSAESIWNWRMTVIDGELVPEQVILHEASTAAAEDGFGSVETQQLRVLSLVEGVYTQTLYSKQKDKEDWIKGPTITPQITGKPMNRIPFVMMGVTGLSWGIEKPPLLDLVDVNLSHYRSSADLEHGRHYTALPTPYITGLTKQAADGQSWTIGAGVAWLLPEGSKADMLEFTGAGLTYLENALTAKEALMVLLGARLLEGQKKAAETAEALRLRQGGESSVLATLVDTVVMGMTHLLAIASEWAGTDEAQAVFEMNKDFVDSRLNATELTALVTAWQGGAMPMDVLLWNMRQGELLPPDYTDEEIKELLKAEEPDLTGTPLGLEE